ncbi:MAG: hypothetical protein FWE80_08940 [Oscillospiraceae bacterium]|nr:hypothetical protein [Oscillospiraceae bacterium]
MKKFAIIFLAIIIVAAFAACGQKAADEADSNASVRDLPDMKPETVQFETGEVTISIPDGWRVAPDEGTPVPFTEQTYDLKLLSPSGEKELGIVTVGKIKGGEPLSTEDFFRLVSTRIELSLPEAAEDEVDFKQVEVHDGDGIYCILTEASLVGKKIPPDEYLYVAMVFANYKNGCLTYSSLLTDDTDSENFAIMLNAVAGLEAAFD